MHSGDKAITRTARAVVYRNMVGLLARSWLARAAGIAVIAQVAGATLTVAVQVVLARMLGADDFGVYSYILSWVLVLALVGNAGMDGAALRFIASYRETGNGAGLRGFSRFALLVVGVAALCVAGVTIVLDAFVDRAAPLGGPDLRWWAAALVVALALTLLYQSVLLGHGRPGLALMPDKVLRPVLILALVAGGWWISAEERLSAHGALVMTLMAASVAVVFLAVAESRLRVRFAGDRPSGDRKGEWLRTALVLLVNNLGQVLFARGGIILAGILLGATAAGAFTVLMTLAGLIMFISNAAASVIYPRISGLHTIGDLRVLERVVAVSTGIFLVPAAAITAVLAIFSETIVGIFGAEFVQVAPLLLPLAVGQLVVVGGGPVGALLTMTGHQIQAAAVVTLMALLYVGLNLALVPRWGLDGAAWALVAVQVLRTVVMSAVAWRRVGVHPPLMVLILGRMRRTGCQTS